MKRNTYNTWTKVFAQQITLNILSYKEIRHFVSNDEFV